MRRRDLIKVFGGGAIAWPLTARAQQTAVPVVGLLDQRSPEELADRLHGFRQGLRDSGFVEGQIVAVLVSPANANYAEATLNEVGTSAHSMGLQIQVLKASTIPEINAAFATLAAARPDALLSVTIPSSTAGVLIWSNSRRVMRSRRHTARAILRKPVGL
jgi:hypothetical protein